MEKQKFEGKTLIDAKNNALEALNASEEEVFIKELEVKKSLFSKKVEIEAITYIDLNQAIKDYLIFLVKGMGLTGNIEFKKREDNLIFNIISPSNSILIGRNGRTIDAIQTLASQMVATELKEYYRFSVDVNDYKSKKKARLEKLAKYTAKDVARSGIAVTLEPMNAYERRIIHSILTNSTDIATESIGEEPNRCIVIKRKEDK